MNINYASSAPFPDGRHPLTAAILSVIPGLGQVYVGDKRKGMLFLNVALINALLLAVCLYANQIVQSLSGLSASYHMRLNADAAGSLRNLEFGSPASLMLLALATVFVLFCARDAYDRAYARRRAIYKDFIVELSEAGSFSYLTHFSLMLCFAVMALFFVVAPPKNEQNLHVYVLTDMLPPSVPKKPTPNVSTKNTQERGSRKATSQAPSATHPTTAPATQTHTQLPHPAQHAPAEAAAKPVPVPVPVPLPAQPHPVPTTPVHPPTPVPISLPTSALRSNNPEPTLRQLNAAAAAAPALKPVKVAMATAVPGPLAPSHAAPAGALPVPTLPQTTGTVSLGVPQVSAAHVMTGGPAEPAMSAVKFLPTPVSSGPGGPAPKAVSAMGPGGESAVAPMPVPTGSTTRGDRSPGELSGPSPRRPGPGADNGRNGPRLMVQPRIAEGDSGVKTTRDIPGPPSPPSRPEPNWPPYMNELQRRIRKHWFPPHAPNSRVAIVTFCISRDGSLSNVRLSQSTGEKRSDDAALQAVQEASPFHPLPDGAPPQVDIEFTFTYSVYNQDGGGMRRVF